MDLANFKSASLANEGAVLELRAPDESPLLTTDKKPITITLLGKDSDVFIKQSNANTNRILNQGGRAKITAEGSKADGTAVLARCTIDWHGIKLDGEELACSYENAIKVYTEFPFIREQVDEFIGDRANFFKGVADDLIGYAEAVYRKGSTPETLPDLPVEVAHVWDWYQRAAKRRQSGMGINPIPYHEFESLSRQLHLQPTVWETELFMRVDDAVLAVVASQQTKPGKSNGPAEVGTDTQGIKALLLSKASVAK